jgi:hypothetical protein
MPIDVSIPFGICGGLVIYGILTKIYKRLKNPMIR